MDNMSKLPAQCVANVGGVGVVAIARGEKGYYKLSPSYSTVEFMDEYNTTQGITPAQVEAMIVGSMFGWDVPGADPDRYQ